ncbi:hypothetical protein HYPSUDRAFT_34413 [Hypholoma sublateritium FD-334 SS-4]|uniref:Uncharacterized protein n=1 Tax=Hypholoma sublateritium (strain FD-334 SS-4) TaxID=945553 RepID=A0A0D2MVS5_HYPSF|nr:hypothetical protein HYPSUDRAFT_34413 [Hypholoma sublateritium FD-334 SS-4]
MSSSRTQHSDGQRQEASESVWSEAPNSQATISTIKIERTVRSAYKRNLQKEQLLKELESRLSDDLSNFRAIESILKDSFTGLQRTQTRAERALRRQVPDIKLELEESMDTLGDLAENLPTIQSQVKTIGSVYESGQEKAKSLVHDLTWLNTEFYERWRAIIFTSSSPVSFRWKVYMRSIFVASFIICSWLFWIAVTGAYRAHRHRLVWGEKLMS